MINTKTLAIVMITSFFSVITMGQPIKNSVPISNNNKGFDYSNLSWIDAFDSLHACLEMRYAYSEWKTVDWPMKMEISHPLILQAQIANDTSAYIKYLLEYLYQIPDGHISLHGDFTDFIEQYMAASYGFNMIPIENGNVLVSYISEDGPAYALGMRSGDRILKWNGINIDSVNRTEYLNYAMNYSTIEGRKFSRYLMLSRDKMGMNAEITYQSYLNNQENTVNITSVNDDMELFEIGFYNTARPLNIDTLVSFKTLESGAAYIYIGAEISEGITPEEIMQHSDFLKIKQAIEYFNENNINKLIFDLRLNQGGNDLQAAVTMGLFYETPSFYEHITSSCDDNYEVIYSLWTEPLLPLYNGDIAVIVDPNCISTGEGFAMMFQRLENAKIVSHWGTNGAFGMVDYEPVILPLGFSVSFPQGRSLDENYNIQLDSDSAMHGGVSPNIIVPLTAENVKRQWEQNIDIQLEYAESLLLKINENSFNDGFNIYPNPCSNILNVEIESQNNSNYSFALFNVLGDLMFEQERSFNKVVSNHTFDISKMKNGLYFLNINNNTKHYNLKLLIKH